MAAGVDQFPSLALVEGYAAGGANGSTGIVLQESSDGLEICKGRLANRLVHKVGIHKNAKQFKAFRNGNEQIRRSPSKGFTSRCLFMIPGIRISPTDYHYHFIVYLNGGYKSNFIMIITVGIYVDT